MEEAELLERVEACVSKLGATARVGGSVLDPPLEVVKLYLRQVRWSWVPVLGRVVSVVAVVRQPVDLKSDAAGRRELLERAARVMGTQVPFTGSRGGMAVPLTLIELTPEPIKPEDDEVLEAALGKEARGRVVPVGWFRVNLGQEAVAMSLRRVPGAPISEPLELAEVLTAVLRRFMPPMEM